MSNHPKKEPTARVLTSLETGNGLGDPQLLTADKDDAPVPEPRRDLLFARVARAIEHRERRDRRPEAGDVFLVTRVELPQDEDGFLAAREEVGAVGGERERRDGVRVPVEDRRRGCGIRRRRRAEGDVAVRLGMGWRGQDVVPQPDLALVVPCREEVLGRVEREGREGLVLGLDGLREPAAVLARPAEVDRVRVDAREDAAVGREGERADDAGDGEADAAGGRDGVRRVGLGRDAVRGGTCGAEADEVHARLGLVVGRGHPFEGLALGRPLDGRRDCRLGLAGRLERDEELIGQVGVGRGVHDGGAHLEGSKEAALEVVPEADVAVCRGDDELAGVRGGEKDGRDCRALEGRGRGR